MHTIGELARSVFRVLTFRGGRAGDFPSNPALMATLWLILTIVVVANALLLSSEYSVMPSGTLHYGGGLILAALAASSAIGRPGDAIRIATAFMSIGLTMVVIWSGIYTLPLDVQDKNALSLVLVAWATGALAWMLRKGWGRSRSHSGTLIAFVSSGSIFFATIEARSLDTYLWPLSPLAAQTQDDQDERYAAVDHETLWPAQPNLVDAVVAKLRKPRGDGARTLVLAVAAGGTQDLFAREAKGSLKVLGARFDSDGRSALLSNARTDLGRVPLATTSNLAQVIHDIGLGFDPARDMLIVYLAAHGSRHAELSTNIPPYDELRPIGAAMLAKALNDAGVKRRIVVVSACYSGTWIPKLASPDTIVITASAADRTSFGCDDRREFTVFGKAFIDGPLRHGASMMQAFEDLNRRVSEEEGRSGASASLPQAFVGANMKRLWSFSGTNPRR